ncbi:hypothetical protein [Amycolatopsis sp. H20-H5]|uniref:hypothetical protein n=1 Tax=Amycolatopsis sp. H20-H5 TaxID=3046309 RepID=UPI002DBCF702|nr:hypothetical protein [Amycolatopsis sp. H20-H5]MEC3982399.1 hypothetical protein [Amycolatopsis sp. H20-H5]
MSGVIVPVTLPSRVAPPTPAQRPAAITLPLALPPPVHDSTAGGRHFSTALLDASGRIQDRGVVAALGWRPGDRLLFTLLRTSVLIARRDDGLFTMPGKPYVALPAIVRSSCGARAGSRVLLVADPDQDVLVVHPEPVVHALLRDFHRTLSAPEATS